ncbi:NADH-quinone oxidoreductase subunit J [bacterium]|nr:NADH-quinone oxidoreductase subunit J [FCB group bacterium]MBL7190251.1 NADH-quinone oxidoreductase subunit J [bacterium]
MNPIIFLILSVITVGAAVMVIFSRNPVSSILYLILAFFCLAAFYVILGAQFIAAVQVIVYAGAIMVLFLFVVMLLNLTKISEGGSAFGKTLGVIAAFILLVAILTVFDKVSLGPAPSTELTTTQSLGEVLFTTYLVPFEIASVLLLAAIVGAVVLVKRSKK